VGYNPHQRGRPSHVYHTYLMGAARLVLDVGVQPGKQTAAQHALPGLWRLPIPPPAAIPECDSDRRGGRAGCRRPA
jgi:hypothetical protein